MQRKPLTAPTLNDNTLKNGTQISGEISLEEFL